MKSGSTVVIALVSSLLMVFISMSPAIALWSSNPSVNTPVITNGVSYAPQMVSDGSGGAIIVWADYRNTPNAKLYAQRIDAQGDPVWTANGVAVCSASGDQTGHQVVSDGSGGVVITWQDTRAAGTNHIYAQRIDADGNMMWAPEGVAVCTAGANQYNPQIVSDYLGGAIITWIDQRTGTYGDVYTQRIDPDGNPAWTLNGVPISTTVNVKQSPLIATDGAGGAIIAWYDNRDVYYSIYAQRIFDDGSVAWTVYPQGKRISPLTITNKMFHSIAYDGMTGIVVTWRDGFEASGYQVYAQRVDINGTLLWGSSAAAVSNVNSSDNEAPVVTDDGSQGAIITWQDSRSGVNPYPNVYAQRINAAGTAMWAANGVMINSLGSVSRHPRIAGDGNHGAVITWQGSDNFDIYARRIDSGGILQWTTSVCTASNMQNSPQIIDNGIDGVIITWTDGRNNYASDIYAQKVKMSNGTLPACPRIALSPSTLPGGSYNTFYNQTFSASGGAGPYSFGLTGDLPDGISFSDATLSGTPTTTGIFPITLRATDLNACLASKNYTLAVKADTTTTITSHTPNPSSGGQTVTINYTVTSSFGTPTGNVTVGDGTVSCTGTVAEGTCSLAFHTIGPKTLTAQYWGNESFNASTSGDEQHDVTQSSIRINGETPSYYATIQSVYNAAEDGDTIQIQAGDFPESLIFNRDISVTIQGGFNTEYTDPSGTTTISGPLTISKGTITVDNLIIY